MKVSEQEIDAYIRAKGIPVEKLADARHVLKSLLRDVSAETYESRKTRRNPNQDDRENQRIELRHSPEDIAKAFTTGWSDPQAWEPLAKDATDKPISTIIPELIRHPDTAWDIRGARINTPHDLAKLMTLCRTPYVEAFRIAFLDSRHRVIHSQLMTIGTLSSTNVQVVSYGREIARLKDRCRASKVISTHNHPSGNPEPSSADFSLTKQLNDVFTRIGLVHVDHVITNGKRFYSFAGEGLMPTETEGYESWLNGRINNPETPPWEIVSRDDLQVIDSPDKKAQLIAALRQNNPESNFLVIVNKKKALTAVDIIDKSIVVGSQEFNRRVFESVGYAGGSAILLGSSTDNFGQSIREIRSLVRFAKRMEIDVLDFTSGAIQSASEENLMVAEESTSYRTASEIREAKLNKSWKVG